MKDLAVFDVEADGFIDEVTQLHCLVIRDYFTKQVYRCYDKASDVVVRDGDLSIEDGLSVLLSYRNVCGHNIIGYDNDVLEKLKDVIVDDGKRNNIDTLIISQTLNPDRQLPKGCPKSVYNPVTKRHDIVTPHSIAAWGYRVGQKKLEVFDWHIFDNHMLNRCDVDTEVQTKVLDALAEEGKFTVEELLK